MNYRKVRLTHVTKVLYASDLYSSYNLLGPCVTDLHVCIANKIIILPSENNICNEVTKICNHGNIPPGDLMKGPQQKC